MPITAEGRWFKDETGRTRILRGVNLSGGSKVPAQPLGYTHLPESLDERRHVSFVGRPCPLEEADEHFLRLKHWGLDFLRLVVTWEALEHEAPGSYDEAFLDYIEALIEKAHGHDINLFIDPHQDVWSRFSGGDGAPAWTFDMVGLEIDNFEATGAALLHQQRLDRFPQLMWASNYNRFAPQTMFTLFFGGNCFAPGRKCEGETLQDFLQGHYIRAFQQLAMRIAHLPNVVGFGAMNEPSAGLIGVKDLRATDHLLVKLEITPSPAEAIFLANGFEQECLDFGQPLIDQLPGNAKKATINPRGMRAWKDECEDIWREVGIWDLDKDGLPRLLRPGHFARADFAQDFLKPFTERFAAAIHEVMPDALIFIESEPLAPPPTYESPGKMVYAPHFYDGATLFTKRFHPQVNINPFKMRPVIGSDNIKAYMRRQIGRFREYADRHMGEVPVVMGEFGIPFDLNGAVAYETGDFSEQACALEYQLGAMDAHLMNYTQWNYSPDNSNEHGDNWNGEDLSIFSLDQQDDPSDIDSGGRALSAVVRPYARKVAGEPLNMRFDPARGLFTFSFRGDSRPTEPTEIYVPNSQYPDGYRVEVSDGEYEVLEDEQRVIYRHSDKDMPHMIRIVSKTPAPPELSPYDKMAIIGLVALFLLFLLGRGGKKGKQ